MKRRRQGDASTEIFIWPLERLALWKRVARRKLEAVGHKLKALRRKLKTFRLRRLESVELRPFVTRERFGF